MKKKQITPKLKFKKMTVVSFTTMQHIIGRQMVNMDTIPISQLGITWQTFTDCYTLNAQKTCISCKAEDCDNPTTRATLTDIGCNPDATRRNCFETARCDW